MASRYPDRRGTPKSDTGDRRRASDALEEIRQWMEDHDDWSRSWTARIEQRMTSVEDRADLLDGRAGNDDGIIGQLGEMRGELKGIERRQERQAKSLTDIRDGVEAVKKTTVQIDGHFPKKRSEKILDFLLKVVLPILLVVIPVVGGIVIAYLQLKGQLAGLGTGR